MSKFHERLVQILDDAGVSLRVASIAAGLSQATLRNQVDRGSPPEFATLQGITAATGVSLGYLVEGRGPRPVPSEVRASIDIAYRIETERRAREKARAARVQRGHVKGRSRDARAT